MKQNLDAPAVRDYLSRFRGVQVSAEDAKFLAAYWHTLQQKEAAPAYADTTEPFALGFSPLWPGAEDIDDA